MKVPPGPSVFEGFTFVRLSDAHLLEVFLELFLQRSPPRLLTAAAWSGLRPAPESRSQGPSPHHAALRHSRLQTELLFHVSLQHTIAKEVEALLLGVSQRSFGLVERKAEFGLT